MASATGVFTAAVTAAVEKMRAAISFQDGKLVERRTALQLLAIALISRSHILLHGNPGNAKSMSVDGLLRHLPELRLVKTQAYKASSPEQFLGPISFKAMEEDEYRRKVDRKFADCEVYFCDEVPRAPRAVLPAFQGGMVEREFDNGDGPKPIDLMTFIGTSNHIPEDDELEAFFDRFLWKLVITPPSSQSSLVEILKGGVQRRSQGSAANAQVDPATVVTREELELLQVAATKVTVPDEVMEALAEVWSNLTGSGVVASVRRYNDFVGGLQAAALLDGRDAVNTDDLMLGEHALWSAEQDQEQVRAEVVKHASDWMRETASVLDAHAEKHDEFAKLQADLAQGADKGELRSSALDLITEQRDVLRPMVEKQISEAQGRDVSRLSNALSEIETTREWVSENLLGGLAV
jgi:MoxR-like ATPase